jgi:TonB family protein
LEHGTPVASAMRVPVVFELAQLKQKNAPLFPPQVLWPVPVKETPAAADRSIEPEYPAELEERRLPGEVHIEFTVDAAGAVSQPRVLWATHPAFVETSLRAIARAGFTPARQGPLVKSSRVQYPVVFGSMGAKPSDVLAANGLTVMGGESLVRQPQLKMLIPPVFPQGRWLAGESGSCTAEFTVDAQGTPREIAILNATHPDFGGAFTAAIEAWAFQPAQNDQGPVAVRIRAVHEFAQRSDLAEFRLGARLKPGAEGIAGPAGLERKLQPLWRGFPVYPQALLERKPSGEALIEFIIDRDGRARLPLVVSATDEAFGWAAATAVSQWVFEPPVRNGQPTDVRVRIPVGFKPPEK